MAFSFFLYALLFSDFQLLIAFLYILSVRNRFAHISFSFFNLDAA